MYQQSLDGNVSINANKQTYVYTYLFSQNNSQHQWGWQVNSKIAKKTTTKILEG